MKLKINKRFLNMLKTPKDLGMSVLLTLIVTEILLGLIESSAAIRRSRRREMSRKSRTPWNCENGFCAKRWNCRSPVAPTVYCGRWNSKKWVCCSYRTAKEQNWNDTATEPSTTSSKAPPRSPPPKSSTMGDLWLYRSNQIKYSGTHLTHGDCDVGYCSKKWNCRTAVTPAVSCGRWNSRKWICCEDRTANKVDWTAQPDNLGPGRSLYPDLSVVGCGIRGHIPIYGSNITSRRAGAGRETEEFDERHEVMPQPKAVVGGREVEPYSWPWMAAIHRETVPRMPRFVCAGSLISDRYILTAAHVFTPSDAKNPGRFLVVLGSHLTAEGVDIRVETITPHPSYRARLYYHDIALLRLETDVTFNNFIRPICLPSPDDAENDLVGTEVTVIGWGDDAFGGVSSPVLKEVSFPVVSQETCNNSYVRVASSTFPRGITHEMICAGAPSGGKDACQGDSGGPLAMLVINRWVIVGIVSFGYRCGDLDYPGVYTRVSTYLNWIAEYVDVIQR